MKMASSSSKTLSSAALFLSLNLIFFSIFSSATASCPIDALKLRVCADVLNGLVKVNIGSSSCCTLINGLADLDAAVCLCTALKADVLGLNLNIPVDLSLVLNACGKSKPSDFTCF